MLLKNVTGETRSFSLTSQFFTRIPVANNGTFTAPDTPEVMTEAVKLVEKGHLQIVNMPGRELFMMPVRPRFAAVTFVATEWAAAGTLTLGGEVWTVDDSEGDQTNAATNFAAWVNANTVLRALGVAAQPPVVVGANSVVHVSVPSGSDPAAYVVEAGTSSKVTEAAAALPATSAVAAPTVFFAHTFDPGGTTPVLVTPLATVSGYLCMVRRSGVEVAYDGVITVTGGVFAFGAAGSVDVASADAITLLAWGTPLVSTQSYT